MKKEKHISKKKNIVARYVSLTLVFVLIMAVIVWAKFYDEKQAKVDTTLPIATYYFDVVGNDTNQKLSQQIQIEQINPGEERMVDFYVRNGNGTEFSQVNMNYQIKLIHTDNLPFEYKLYDDDDNLLTSVDAVSVTSNNINDGSVKTYTTDSNGDDFVLDINEIDGTGNMDVKHYKLLIIWSGDSSENVDFKYVKDLDLIYLNVEAYEEEPNE